MTEPKNNDRLQELYLGDQKDREAVYHDPARIEDLKARDTLRRKLAYEMMTQGAVQTPQDLYNAAVILQHGADRKDYLAAHRLAALAALAGHRPSRWLMAASLDRYLSSLGQPQVYGTQFDYDQTENRYRARMPIEDGSVLPFEKQALDVPPIADRLAQLNGRIKGA